MTTPTSSRRGGSPAKAAAGTGGTPTKARAAPQSTQTRSASTATRTGTTAKSATGGGRARTTTAAAGKKSAQPAKAAKAAKAAKGKAEKTAKRSQTAKAAKGMTTERSNGQRSVTVTVPTLKTMGHATTHAASGAAHAAMMPFTVARRVLPAKGGLPLYAGLGVLGATEVLEWPVAVGIGVGYAVLRRGGAMASPAETRKAAA